MRKLNNEQKIIVDDILYKKTKDRWKPLQFFLIGGVGMGNKSHLYA
jgi:hypothetical protein